MRGKLCWRLLWCSSRFVALMLRLLLPLWLRLHCHRGQESRVYLAEGWPNGADKLKSGMGLEHTRHRSSINAFVHTLSCPTNRLLKETLENSPLPQRPGRGINTDSRLRRLLVSHASLNPKRDLMCPWSHPPTQLPTHPERDPHRTRPDH